MFNLGSAGFSLGVMGFNETMSILGEVKDAIYGLVAPLVALGAQAEQTQVAFTTLLGSADAARKLIAELREFAIVTPFQEQELLNASQQLMAYGVAAKDIVPTLRMLGDVAATGVSSMSHLMFLYGTSMTEGRAYARDIRQWTSQGIPMLDLLQKELGVDTPAAVTKLVAEGKVGFAAIHNALRSMTGEGGKFHDTMEAQSRTLAGAWSNLKDAFTSKFLRPIGEALVESLRLTDVVKALGDYFLALGPVALDMISALKPVLTLMADIFIRCIEFLRDLTLLAGIAFNQFRMWGAAWRGNERDLAAYTKRQEELLAMLGQFQVGGKPKTEIPLPDRMAAGDLGAADKAAKKGPEFMGLAELARHMQTAAWSRERERRVDELARRSAAASEKLANAETEGLRVRLIAGAGAPGGLAWS